MFKQFAFDNSFASIEECLEALEHRDRHKSEEFIGFSTQGFYSPKHSHNTTTSEKYSRCKHEHQILSIKHEIEGLKTIFTEKSEQTQNLESLFKGALNQISLEIEGIDQKLGKISLIESKISKTLYPEQKLHSSAIFLNSHKNLSRSPRDFSFSNNEGEETSNFSFGQTEENIDFHPPIEKDCKDFEEFLEKQQSSSLISDKIHEKHEDRQNPYFLDSSLNDLCLTPGMFLSEKFRIERIIKSNLLFTLVQCFDVFKHKKVAVKVVHGQTEVFAQGLEEIKVLNMLQKSLKHTGQRFVVKMIEFFYFNDHLHIVFELLGDSLAVLNSSQVFQNSFKNIHLARIAYQVLKGLSFIHSQGVIHSNIHLKNLLVSSTKSHLNELHIKIVGFEEGLCSSVNILHPRQLKDNLPPEVIVGGVYSEKTDVWSLGCALGELASGQVMFRGSSSDDLLRKVRNN